MAVIGGTQISTSQAAGSGGGAAGVSALNAKTGAVTITSPDASVGVGSSGNAITLTGAGLVQKFTSVLHPSDFFAMPVTPFQVLDAPGAGKVWHVVNIGWYYKFNTTPYTVTVAQGLFTGFASDLSGGIIDVITGTGAGVIPITGVLDQTVDTSARLLMTDDDYFATAGVENQGVFVNLQPGDLITLGDGDVTIIVYAILEDAP